MEAVEFTEAVFDARFRTIFRVVFNGFSMILTSFLLFLEVFRFFS